MIIYIVGTDCLDMYDGWKLKVDFSRQTKRGWRNMVVPTKIRQHGNVICKRCTDTQNKLIVELSVGLKLYVVISLLPPEYRKRCI